jgi:hypothetical protein
MVSVVTVGAVQPDHRRRQGHRRRRSRHDARRHFAETVERRRFRAVDTGGITDDPQAPMDVEIRRQGTGDRRSGLALFIVDARTGLHRGLQRRQVANLEAVAARRTR